MKRRVEQRSGDKAMSDGGGDDCAPAKEPEQLKAGAPEARAATIEISDEDYRTLHLPCEALDDSGSSEPGC